MMGLDLQPDLCSLLIDDVIYHEAAVRQAGAEALSQAVARYQRQAAEVMGRLMEIYQEKLYVSGLCTPLWAGPGEAGLESTQPQTCSGKESWNSLWPKVVVTDIPPPSWLAGSPCLGCLCHCSALISFSVAAATPSAGCLGTSHLRISSRSVGGQV